MVIYSYDNWSDYGDDLGRVYVATQADAVKAAQAVLKAGGDGWDDDFAIEIWEHSFVVDRELVLALLNREDEAIGARTVEFVKPVTQGWGKGKHRTARTSPPA